MSTPELPPLIVFKMRRLGMSNAGLAAACKVDGVEFKRHPEGTLADAELLVDAFLADIRKWIIGTYDSNEDLYDEAAGQYHASPILPHE